MTDNRVPGLRFSEYAFFLWSVPARCSHHKPMLCGGRGHELGSISEICFRLMNECLCELGSRRKYSCFQNN